jgi:hypothetical protein
LIENNYAVQYPKHMKLLKELFRENDLPVAKTEDEALDLEKGCTKLLECFDFKIENNPISYAYLNKSDNTYNNVYVSAVETPAHFYLQNMYSYELLEKLNDDIKTHLKKIELFKKKQSLIEEKHKQSEHEREANAYNQNYLKRSEYLQTNLDKRKLEWLQAKNIGLYCLAKLKKEELYFRAKIISINEISQNRNEDEIEVFFVDYGDSDKIDRTEIYPLDQYFIRTCPFQAIECSLDGIIPHKETKWTGKAGDLFWNLTHLNNGVHIESKAQVVSVLDSTANTNNTNKNREDFQPTEQKRYNIKLSTEHFPDFIDVSYKLVENKLARLTREEEEKLFNLKLINDSRYKLSNLVNMFLEAFIIKCCFFFLLQIQLF